MIKAKHRATTAVVFLFVISPFGLLPSARAAQSNSESQCCSMVTRALEAVNRIKKGMLRENIEKDFTQDGGIDFGSVTVYTFKLCPLIKIRVEFDQKEASAQSVNNRLKDVVRSVSKPYIEYPARD